MLAHQQERFVGRDVPADALSVEPLGVERCHAAGQHLRDQIDTRATRPRAMLLRLLAEAEDPIRRVLRSPESGCAPAW